MAIVSFQSTETYTQGMVEYPFKILNFTPVGVVGSIKSPTIKSNGIFKEITIAAFASVALPHVETGAILSYKIESSINRTTWNPVDPIQSNGSPLGNGEISFWLENYAGVSWYTLKDDCERRFNTSRTGVMTFKVPYVANLSYRISQWACLPVAATITTVILAENA